MTDYQILNFRNKKNIKKQEKKFAKNLHNSKMPCIFAPQLRKTVMLILKVKGY